MPAFDYTAAKRDGVSDEEISAFIEQQRAKGIDLYIPKEQYVLTNVRGEKNFFGKETIKNVGKNFARAAVSVAKTAEGVANLGAYGMARLSGDKQAAQRILNANPAATNRQGQSLGNETANLPIFGMTRPIDNPADAVAAGADIGSYFTGVGAGKKFLEMAGKQGVKAVSRRALTPIVKETVKGVAKKSLNPIYKEGMYIGGTAGLNRGLSADDPTAGGIAANVVGGTVLGGLTSPVLGLAGTVASKAISPLTKRTEKALNEFIDDTFSRAIKPSVAGRKTLAQQTAYKVRARSAVRTIAENKDNLKFITPDGEEVVGRTPQTLHEFSQAIDQTKKTIFNRYNQLAQETGQAGVTIDIAPLADELDAVINNKSLALTHPNAVQYAKGLKERLVTLGKVDPETAQKIIENYNASLQAFYRNPTYNDTSKAAIDAGVVNKMRKLLDDAIEQVTGKDYQAYKNQYGALKAIEKDVINRANVEARKTNRGLIDYTDIFSGSDMVTGILTANPTMFVRGTVQKGIKEWFKALNDPNRAIKRIFHNTESYMTTPKTGRVSDAANRFLYGSNL